MSALITTEEYELYTNDSISGTLSDAYIAVILEAVSDDVNELCGSQFGSRAVSDEPTSALVTEYNGGACLYVEGSVTPITAITSLSVWLIVTVDPVAVTITNAMLNESRTAFYTPFGVFGIWQSFYTMNQRYRAKVSYTAGATIPATVKRAIALLAQEAFAEDAANSSTSVDKISEYRLGDYTEKKAVRDLSASDGLGLGTANSIRAAQILSRYRKSGMVML